MNPTTMPMFEIIKRSDGGYYLMFDNRLMTIPQLPVDDGSVGMWSEFISWINANSLDIYLALFRLHGSEDQKPTAVARYEPGKREW